MQLDIKLHSNNKQRENEMIYVDIFALIIILVAFFAVIYVFITSLLSRKLRRIPRFPAIELDTPEYSRKNFKITLTDGTQIAAYHYKPKSTNPTGITFVATHGFINTALASDDVYLATSLVTAGHQVISYDSRFHGNSTSKNYCHYTPKYFPLAMLQDTAEILEFIKQMPEVDREKLGFIGFSFGGTIALSGAIRDPDISCIIAGCAIHSYNDLANVHLHKPLWMDRFLTKEIFFHRQRTRKFYDVFEQVSPKNHAAFGKGKNLFLLHCKNDTIVPFDISFPKNLSTFKIPDENVVVFDKGGHKFLNHREDVKNIILEWITRCFN
jgi:alpha-beta hydrolase superfamily lysophospholipase